VPKRIIFHCAARVFPYFTAIDANAIGKSFYLLIHLNAISCALQGASEQRDEEGNQVICKMQSSRVNESTKAKGIMNEFSRAQLTSTLLPIVASNS